MVPIGGPNAATLSEHAQVVNLCVPDLHLTPERAKQVKFGCRVLNGDWRLRRLGHHCIWRRGAPCCSSMDDVVNLLKQAIVALLCWVLPGIPTVTRWLTVFSCNGWFLLGGLVHSLLPRAYVAAFGKENEALGPGLDADEKKTDDWTWSLDQLAL